MLILADRRNWLADDTSPCQNRPHVDFRRASMTHTEFRTALRRLGISQRRFADRIGVGHDTVNRWATGKRPVTPCAAYVLTLLAERREISERLAR